MPKQDADVLEVLIGKVRKDRDVDAVLRKCAGVLRQAEPCEPIGYFLHHRPVPGTLPGFDPPDAQLYLIGRKARSRAKPTARASPWRTAASGSRESAADASSCPGRAQWAVHALRTVLRAPSPRRRETTMPTSAERMRALRERERRGLRRLTIDVSEDDLRAIAKRGYEGAASRTPDPTLSAFS
jgi:hypothetical protein